MPAVSAVVEGSVGAAGAAGMQLANPGTPRGVVRKTGASGNTPAAKRAVSLDEVMAQAAQGPEGPPMDLAAILRFVYSLKHEVDGLKHWGATVNVGLEDHASRLGGLRIGALARIREDVAAEIAGVRDELNVPVPAEAQDLAHHAL